MSKHVAVNKSDKKRVLCVTDLIRKVKAVPLQTRTGPRGSRRLRPPDFLTVGT